MNIIVENNVLNVKMTVNEDQNGGVSIVLSEENRLALGDVECGKVIKLGDREFYVVGHGEDTTAVLTKDAVKYMEFGGDGDWRDSDVRKFCNGEFYKELAATVGADNIFKHTVKLIADDGTGKGLACKDDVSILTSDLYRRYREYLPAMDRAWWTATRVTHHKGICYTRGICCVFADGILRWNDCCFCRGVRPFCILNSSILVSRLLHER